MSDFLTPYRVTSPYGRRSDPFNGNKVHHTGIDLVKRSGGKNAPIESFTDGVVIFANEVPSNIKGTGYGGFGLVVAIQDKNNHNLMYAHLSKSLVKVGDKVKAGQVIGLQGSTGRSTGEHLHFEVRAMCSPCGGFGNDINPIEYLDKHYKKEQPVASPITSIKNKEDEFMKFIMSEQGKSYAKEAINSLSKKGYLNSPSDWEKRVDNGEIYQELPWMTLLLLDRISDHQ
ncbi:M23 family metallopeptidase [Brevibacillus laterosporus]|nr:M23 family metallopeptidase [Brevibacillus laterosporus]TPG68731.1 M23 family metallopeptidase [Brevibacillus laterosporus]